MNTDEYKEETFSDSTDNLSTTEIQAKYSSVLDYPLKGKLGTQYLS